jgi:hypothetical protein
VRLAVHPLRDWHGFATISVPNEKGFSLVVSKAGDWTNSRIIEPPTKIWVRGAPCFGVLRIVPLFRRVVFVATGKNFSVHNPALVHLGTGSGIGPCAPCILEQRVPIRLLWTSPNVRETFGDKLVDQILGASPDAVIYGRGTKCYYKFCVLTVARHAETRQTRYGEGKNRMNSSIMHITHKALVDTSPRF